MLNAKFAIQTNAFLSFQPNRLVFINQWLILTKSAREHALFYVILQENMHPLFIHKIFLVQDLHEAWKQNWKLLGHEI